MNERLPVILIGATGSIGSAILAQLLSNGYSVHATVRSESDRSSLVERFGNDTLSISFLDVRDQSAIRETVREVADRAGGILGLVYAAGIQLRTPLNVFSVEQMRDVMDVNLFGAVVATQGALPHMVPRRNGRFIFVGSLTSNFSINGIAPYAMSKSALSSWARSVAVEHAHEGITANVVVPGRIESTMTADVLSDSRRESTLSRVPAGRFGIPNDVSDAVLFLLSSGTAYINGIELVVDGGWLAGGGNVSG